MAPPEDLRRERAYWEALRARVAAGGLAALDGHSEHWPRLLAAVHDCRHPGHDLARDLLVVGAVGDMTAAETAVALNPRSWHRAGAVIPARSRKSTGPYDSATKNGLELCFAK
jgi:hypothetical protein